MTAPPTPARQLSILVVDDEPTIRFALRRYFARAGWIAEEADDGSSALVALLAPGARYDVVLCDIRMPGVSGVELYRRLASDAPQWIDHLVLASGNVSASDNETMMSEVRCPVIEKPFDLAALVALATEIAARPMAA